MNEPVAWIAKTYYPNGLFEDDLVWSKIDENSIPLYTHPVKELTDEEIWDWFKENTALTKESALMIARAILRKAQEK